ncbi:PorV/PorQ family protein [Parasediminibacterium sp. JCM 36343]|uniref:putative type IX sorting system protein PorV2 n=1 Tax=Parasediminibacterium sp. JCM 36343 TaxID=3374279 RepID=UPI003978404C
MKLQKLFFGLMVLLLLCNASFAQFRKYSNEFLNIGAGARGLGMGGAQIASVQDGTSGYWNPAGLVYIKNNPQLSLMHAEYFSGIAKYDFASLALPTKDGKRVLGISFLRFGVDDIPNTLYLVQPDGSINYNNITSFSSADNAVLLSYAEKVKDFHGFKINVGGNAKIIYRKVGTFAQAWGFGIDLGVQATKGNWRLGAVLRDATTTFNAWSFSFTDKEKEVLYLTNNDIPVKSTENTAPRLVGGVGYNFTINSKFHLLAEADLSFTFDGKRNTLVSTNAISIDPNVGLEANFNSHLFLRAGISNFQRALSDGDLNNQKKVWIYQPSLGAGFKVGNVGIDYAFTNLANQSNPLYTHIFSLKIDLVKNHR